MSDFYFNQESDYSEENTSDNEDFCSTMKLCFHRSSTIWGWTEKKSDNESHEWETTEVIRRYSSK